MKVLVTGALGNVGAYTVGALLEEGHDVVGFDLDISEGAQGRLAARPARPRRLGRRRPTPNRSARH